MENKSIRRILVILHSRDHRYFGFRYIECETGRMVEGQISGGESNIKSAFTYNHEKDEWRNDYFYTYSQMKEKELFALPHAGCAPKDIWAWAQNNLTN